MKNKITYNISQEFDLVMIQDKSQRYYIENRIIAQIKWYDSKAIKLQQKYKISLKTLAIISISIPVLTLFSYKYIIKVLIAIIGSISSVISYFVSVDSCKELWLRYRSNCELLKSELHKYLSCSNSFTQKEFNIFVSKCEDCFTSEFLSWKDTQSSTNTQFSSSIGS